jgi:adenine phosphoribosyltransferase
MPTQGSSAAASGGAAPNIEAELKKLIREVPDFPKPGILFYDITTLLRDASGLELMLREMSSPFESDSPDLVVGVEARGFVFGAAMAGRLNAGFVPVRKPNKLPAETVQVSYELEYGEDTLEVHRDAIEPGQKVLVVDDLLATGGTAAATCRLIEQLGGQVTALAFAVELTFLNGRDKLDGYEIFSLLQYHE